MSDHTLEQNILIISWLFTLTQTFLGLSRVERGKERVTSLRTSAWEAIGYYFCFKVSLLHGKL